MQLGPFVDQLTWLIVWLMMNKLYFYVIFGFSAKALFTEQCGNSQLSKNPYSPFVQVHMKEEPIFQKLH